MFTRTMTWIFKALRLCVSYFSLRILNSWYKWATILVRVNWLVSRGKLVFSIIPWCVGLQLWQWWQMQPTGIFWMPCSKVLVGTWDPLSYYLWMGSSQLQASVGFWNRKVPWAVASQEERCCQSGLRQDTTALRACIPQLWLSLCWQI